jgi:hypothetical protein
LEHQCLLEANLSRTSISENDCTHLLMRVAQNNVTLKAFGCSFISASQLDILVSNLHKRIQVNFISFDCDLFLLKDLENLQVLRLQSGRFFLVKDMLLVSRRLLLVLERVRHWY